MRVLLNLSLILFEIAACAGIAWLGLAHPLLFAAVTGGLAFGLGLRLEILRLRNEMPFYFGPGNSLRGLFVPIVGFGEAVFKGLLAGVAALFTFSGTDQDRLFWVAIAFGLTIYAGTALLRYLAIKLDARPERWGILSARSAPRPLVFKCDRVSCALWSRTVAHRQRHRLDDRLGNAKDPHG